MSLATSVVASCGTANFETIIGGYPDHHGLKSIDFDVDVTSGDMVVAGRILKDKSDEGFVYYIDESLCKIRWMVTDSTFIGDGVKNIVFDPNDSNRIFGYTESGPALFWIDNNFHTDVPEVSIMSTYDDES